ncbi:MAG: hypothetical protein MJ166_05985 [Clostridia bacterium]|nr:hypothetical protein [Clostridia bacterium]
MLVIALDEAGYFGDGQDDGSKVFFIGGVVFHADDDNAYNNELKRLQKWFKDCCTKCRASYPEDLHRNHNNTNVDATIAVKKQLRKTVSDFINGSAEWGKPNGTYDFYAMVGSLNESPKVFSDKSNLIEDNYASNRYQHIAYLTLDRLLYRTHQLNDDKSIKLHIATRVLYDIRDKIAEKELKEIGHSKYSKITQITDTNSYRGMLISSIPGSNRRDSRFEVDVRSIKYDSDATNLGQGFFYLADSVCSFFGDEIKKVNTIVGMKRIESFCRDSFNTGNCYVWSYDEVDALWVEALKALEAGDYFKSLGYLFDSQSENQEIYEFYKENWHKHIIETIQNSEDYLKLKYAIDALKEYYLGTYANDKGDYILSPLETAIINNKDRNEFKGLLYELYVLKMTIANHNGDYKASEKYFDMAHKYADYTSIENFCEMRNKYAVSLCDALRFDVAKKYTSDTIRFLNEYIEWRKGYTNVEIPMILGRSYSQEGQAYAFLENYEEAINSFEKALGVFEKGSNDYQRTMSYYLHALIEAGDKDKYKEKAAEYFGTSDLKEQYLHSGDIPYAHQAFVLYVYIKALYVLNLIDELGQEGTNEFLRWMDKKLEQDAQGMNHPYELIIKYCAFVQNMNGNPLKAKKYMNMIEDLEGDTVISKIIENGYEEYERIRSKKHPFEDDKFTYMYR